MKKLEAECSLDTALVVTSMWPEIGNEGNGMFVAQQVEALSQRARRVVVCVMKPFGRRLAPRYSKTRNNVHLHLLHFPVVPQRLSLRISILLNLWLGKWSLARCLPNLVGRAQPSIILLHDFRHAGLSLPDGYAPAAPRGLIIHGYDMGLQEGVKRSAAIRKAVDRCMRRAAVVFPVGEHLGPYLDDLSVAGEKLRVHCVHNGHKAGHGSQRSSITTGTLTVACLSNLVPWKGVDIAIRAFSELAASIKCRDVKMVVIGDGPERGALEKLASDLGLRERLRFLGRLSYAESMDMLASGDIFCLPSWREPFGIAFLEAMARGCVPIGVRGTGAEITIEDQISGFLCEPRNTGSVAQCLIALANDDRLRARMAKAAQARALTFSWDKNVDRLIAELDEASRSLHVQQGLRTHKSSDH